MSLRKTIVSQVRKPHGALGRLMGWIMANRPSNRERNIWTIELLKAEKDDRILEIGCGPGIGLQACLELGKGIHILGLDHSRTMLDQAKARNAKSLVDGRLDLRLGSLDDVSAAEDLFDRAYSVNVVQFLPDKAAAFDALFALMKPNGTVATTYMPRHKNPTRDDAFKMAREVEAHMKNAGFARLRIEELALKPVPAVCVLGERP